MSRRRLSDTAVTPSDWSIENATVSEYDGSLPSSVMSVPCSVVMTFGTLRIRAAVCRREDLLREIRGGRVRDRVVRVDDVEGELARQLDDLVRQRQQVLRLAEQRIASACGRGETPARLVIAETERRLGADEVHLVAAPRERLRQLGGDDAAAADRRVTDDPDIH